MDADHSFGSNTRRNVFLTITAVIFLLFSGRLVQLQLIDGSQYRVKSEAQGIKQIPEEPIRGALFDRYGIVLAADVPSYSVYITPNKLNAESKRLLAGILNTDTITINARIKQYKVNDFSPVRIWRDVDRRAWARLNEMHSELAGISIIGESKRNYAGDLRASHVLGYTKEISKEELEKMGDYYTPGDVVGKAGVENAYEDFLRGEKGYRFVMVNNRGQRMGDYEGGKHNVSPKNGFDLVLGIDGGLQQYAEQLLRGKSGAVVALDPNNGEILAMASAPDYDPGMFSGITDRVEYNRAIKDPMKPLFNRATQAVYAPGSTWKMLMAVAALQEGMITTTSTIACGGAFSFGGRSWGCHGAHGAVNVRKAIHVSCNVFFYKLGLQMGIDKYNKYGALFHFGQRLGLDIPEAGTLLPSRAYYDKAFGVDKWPKGVMVNLGIGQGELLVNPVQLAAYAGALANGGTWIQPHLVKAVRNKRLGQEQPVTYNSEDLGIKPEYMKMIQAGMFDVVNTPGGTAKGAKLDSIVIAGKTGTAQTPGDKRDNAWFICYAPYDKPKIALCVLVEFSGFGGTHSAPIARKLVRYFFTREKEVEDQGDVKLLRKGGLPPVQKETKAAAKKDSTKPPVQPKRDTAGGLRVAAAR
ncbi:MAG: penicillin-binding protein 2 [bacterium]|nr:penicillin-binding protein 2 [Candidatus Kapabacteria bacterium]